MARGKKLKARPRESIHEIRAAGRESERRAKEKSKIFLFTVCRRKSQAIFDGRRGSFFPDSWPFFPVRFFSGISDSGSPPIPGPLRFQRNLRGRPFFRFQRNRKERQDFFPSAPQGQRKKTRVFLRAIYGSEETTERKIFDLSFLESEGKA